MNHFNLHAPEIKYVQDDVNNYYFSSLTSDMFDTRSYIVEQAIVS